MTIQEELKTQTERFTGPNTVLNSSSTTFLMVEMENKFLANKVYEAWSKMKNVTVEILENKVYGFPN